jgi:DNA-binding protein H-NS
MSAYSDICGRNRQLFAELEQCSYDIAYYMLHKHYAEAEARQEKKDELKLLIGANLDKLEELWEVESKTVARDDKVRTATATPGERLVIKSFTNNPDQTVDQLAAANDVSPSTAAHILKKLFNKEYIGI